MPALKSFEVTARPSKKEAGSAFWSTSFFLFDSDENTGAKRTTLQASTPQELTLAAMAWMEGLTLAEEFQGWSWSVAKPARWPQGFKRFERAGLIFQVREAA